MKQALLTALLGLAALASSGCNCTCQYLRCLRQQICCCDPCRGHHCDCGECCEQPCDGGYEEYGHGGCDCGHADSGCTSCLPSLGCLDCCSQGCGERYYGDWFYGEHCDPCDGHGNWVGPNRYYGHPVGHPGPHGPIRPGPRVIGSHPKEAPAEEQRR
jgi:hypothetical protein